MEGWVIRSVTNSVAILIPIFNDWESVRMLLPQIGSALENTSWRGQVCLVDDGSTAQLPHQWSTDFPQCLESIEVLHQRRNLGHQRAIAMGLFHIHENYQAAAVLVMDGDGEDRAQDIAALLAEFDRLDRKEVVFAARTKRMEGALFKTFYVLYRWSHHLLTGITVQVGNFSVIPPLALSRLMVVSELWNHYAAAIFRARIPHSLLPLPRGQRLTGDSKMNFVSLLVHGLSAMSVFSDQVSARVLIGAMGLATILAASMLLWPGENGWVMILLGVEVIMLSLQFVFTIISGRNNLGFIPIRDSRYFTMSRTAILQRINSMDSLAAALGGVTARTLAEDSTKERQIFYDRH